MEHVLLHSPFKIPYGSASNLMNCLGPRHFPVNLACSKSKLFNQFYVIHNLSSKQQFAGCSEEEEVRTLARGDYFGEQALLKEDCRTANVIALPPGVECLTLDRELVSNVSR